MSEAKAHVPDRYADMNSLEKAWARELDKQGGLTWAYESIKLKLAPKTFYTPDFFVVTDEGKCAFHETKGFMRDDAAVKLKVAARMYPWFDFVLITRIPKRDGGGFNVREVKR